MANYLTISNNKELYRFPTDSIIYVVGDGNYCDLYMVDKQKYTFAIQLGKMEEQMQLQLGQNSRNLVRIGKSLIINTDYLAHINPSKRELVLSDYRGYINKLSASVEALTTLKVFMESLIPTIKTE